MNKHTPMAFVKARYAELQPDGHWFDKSTLHWFRCRLPRYCYGTPDGYLFVTSEKCEFVGSDHPRMYTVRQQTADGRIATVGEFNSYRTQYEAMTALRAHLSALFAAAQVAA